MKAGLAASIFALDAITLSGFSLRGDVQIQSVVEEEITGNGAATLLANGFVADVVVSCEPTDEQLVLANSGVIKFRIITQGEPAHPRTPEAGSSAIDLMVRLLSHLPKLEARWINEGRTRALFSGIVNPVALTIGTICGGDYIASIPATCSVEGRIGFYPGDDPKVRATEFEAFVRNLQSEDPTLGDGRCVEVTWVGVMQAGYELMTDTPAATCLRGAHAAANQGSTLKSHVMTCYLDAALYAVHGNIPSLVYGPVAENIHGFDERVSLSSLRRVTKTIALFAATWCGIEPLQGDRCGS